MSIACNHLLRITHVQNKYVVSVTRNIVLCYADRQNQTTNDKGTTSNLPANAKGTTNAEVNTYCSFKGKPRNHILLATAIIEVRNKSGQYVPCRTLLDSASQ